MSAKSITPSEIKSTPVESIKPHPKNPRRGDVDAIAESIQKNGFFGVIVVQKSTGFILAGNHRYLAAVKLGMTHVPVHFIDADDARAERILLADNRTADRATYDPDVLFALLEQSLAANNIEGTGYSLDDATAIVETARKAASYTGTKQREGDDSTVEKAVRLWGDLKLRLSNETIEHFRAAQDARKFSGDDEGFILSLLEGKPNE